MGSVFAATAAPLSSSTAASGGDGESHRRGVAMLLRMPGGPWIVGAVGLGMVVYGVWQAYRGLSDRFTKKYNSAAMSDAERTVALYSGRIGLSARGITYAVIGAFVIVAAVQLDPSETRSVGGALDMLAAQPYGAWVLLAVAIGLIGYGVYCLVQARYRTFRVN
ncbi:MAG: hypothetical protein CMJ58_08685 [Planctomycetaceae bacterium]|nr:hypothetical protein [Planctomycetaceae bacterium]